MNRLLVLFGVWTVMVLAALWLQTELHWAPIVKASEGLPRNHLLQTGDVFMPGISRRYLREAAEKDQPLRIADLAPEPMLPPRILSLTASVQKSWVADGSVNTGKEVRLCRAQKEAYSQPLKVLTVQCGLTADDKMCVVAVVQPSVASNMLEELTAADVVAHPFKIGCK
jgi:hypothetical protein